MSVRVVVLGLSLGLLACSASAPQQTRVSETVVSRIAIPRHGPSGHGTTTVSAVDNLDWPFRMSKLLVAVDGLLIYHDRDHLDLEDRSVLAVLELEPGAHMLQVLMRATYASTPLSDADCEVEWRLTKAFGIGTESVHVKLNAYLTPPLDGFFERLDMNITIDGSNYVVDSLIAHGPPDATDVMSLLRARLRHARIEKDIIHLSCLNDKYEHARRLMIMREKHHLDDVADVIDDKLHQIFVEAQQCIDRGSYFEEHDSRVLFESDADLCTQRGPLMEPTNENGPPLGGPFL